MKGDYKRLMKAKDSMDAKVTEARAKLGEMQSMGDTYFTGRAQSIKGIQDPALLSRAQQRLQDNQKAFGGVLQGLREAGDAIEPFRKNSRPDYLPGQRSVAVRDCVTEAECRETEPAGRRSLFQIDEAVKRANLYFQSLKATES